MKPFKKNKEITKFRRIWSWNRLHGKLTEGQKTDQFSQRLYDAQIAFSNK